MTARLRVAIVGGGFSGAAVALNLCRTGQPLAISVIEPRPVLGAGLAYSAPDPAHRINVPAAKMEVLPEDPERFHAWSLAHGAAADDPASLGPRGDLYPSRAAFGRYVAELLAQAAAAEPAVTLTHHRSRACHAAREGGAWRLTLEDGSALLAERLVLAATHPAATIPGPLAPLAGHPALATDPWSPASLAGLPTHGAVAIVGTGLTMADIAASLAERRHAGPILAFSRRGLLSRGHPPAPPARREHFTRTLAPPTALALLRAVRRQMAEANAEGAPWQAVLDDARAAGHRLWSALDQNERQRFLRHLRPWWDVHRFRVSPQAEAAIAALRAQEVLTVRAASLRAAWPEGPRIVLVLRGRGAAADDPPQPFDRVILATGPAHAEAIARNPLYASLAQGGWLRADPSGLGIDVDETSRALGRNDEPVADLFVAGPLARGRFGELMGLPQVSHHAALVASEVGGGREA